MGRNQTEDNPTTEQVGYRNPIAQLGWAKIDHILTFDPTLSDGAFRTYAMLIYHAQQAGETYVSLDTIGNERDLRRETISAHIKELEDHGLITRTAREGTSSLTEIDDLPKVYEDMAAVVLHARKNKQQTDLLEKTHTPCAINLTQERKKEFNNNNNNAPAEIAKTPPLSETWYTELEQLTGGYMGGAQEMQDLTAAWQKFPDARRHEEGKRQLQNARSRTIRVYLKAFLTFNPDYVPPKPAAPPRAAPRAPASTAPPDADAARQRAIAEWKRARLANSTGIGASGKSP